MQTSHRTSISGLLSQIFQIIHPSGLSTFDIAQCSKNSPVRRCTGLKFGDIEARKNLPEFSGTLSGFREFAWSSGYLPCGELRIWGFFYEVWGTRLMFRVLPKRQRYRISGNWVREVCLKFRELARSSGNFRKNLGPTVKFANFYQNC